MATAPSTTRPRASVHLVAPTGESPALSLRFMVASNATDHPHPHHGPSGLEDFMLGGVSAAVSKTIAAPIERVKLLLQNQGESHAVKSQGEYKGIVDVFVRVPREQGFLSFWRGNLANVIRYFPTQALNFMFKEQIKRVFDTPPGSPFHRKLLSNMASGGVAGGLSLVVVYPLDFARTRLAVDVGRGGAREFTGLLDCIRKTSATSGMFRKGGVYNGFWVSCVGIVVYRGLYFGLYDSLSSYAATGGFAAKFALGFAVTTVGETVSYPIDTIRRRLMMVAGASTQGKYRSGTHAFGVILREEGVRGFFKGAASNVIRGLGGALVLVGFDYLKDAKDKALGRT